MNEKEFAKSILKQVQSNKDLMDWYTKNLEDKPFTDTVDILLKSLANPLTTREVIIMALFIGLSTETKKGFFKRF